MSSVNGVNGSAGVAGMDALDVTGLSPDAIIGFCEMQLNNYGAQISDLVSQQKQSMADQGVISNLKSQLEQQGKPTNAKQMNQVYNDYQTALASCRTAIRPSNSCRRRATTCATPTGTRRPRR